MSILKILQRDSELSEEMIVNNQLLQKELDKFKIDEHMYQSQHGKLEVYQDFYGTETLYFNKDRVDAEASVAEKVHLLVFGSLII